ncbi:MAG: putative two-component response regulator [Chloroflexi bacterium OLB14]|nr:MAG: putative two-component response regulator [Chloroflexi bacterium OLB14]
MTIIDINTFNVLKESTDAEFIQELINTFLEDAPNQIEQMKNALTQKDAELFTRAAHTVKSNAATFGATELANLARELESMGRENNLEIGNKLQVMQEAFYQVKNQLEELK